MAKRPELIESETLPCGCIIGTTVVDGERTAVFEPHDIACEFYRYFVAEVKKAGKPISLRSVD